MTSPKDIFKHGKVLWDYHTMSSPSRKVDIIIALGSHDVRTAEHAASLYLKGYAKILICAGGFGKVTSVIWNMSEAEKFREIAVELGVPKEKILVETKSANTGDNFTFSRALINNTNISAKTGVIVTKPYMSRRAYATGSKQWPEIEWYTDAPKISYEDYPNKEVSFERMINLMVGDLQRIDIYSEKGFQISQVIPKNVWNSYYALVAAGFNQFVIEN